MEEREKLVSVQSATSGKSNRFYRLTRPLLQDGSTRKFVTVLVVMFVMFLAASLTIVSRRQSTLRLGYELSKLTREKSKLAEAVRELEIERAILVAPERIRRLATELGMQPPSGDNTKTIKSQAVAAEAQ